jgi:DNA-binding GntR family transcriptional regulator
LQADKDAFAAIEAMDEEQETETQAEAAAKAARDDATAAEWDFHNAILGAKQQVTAQYGADSNEVQSVGLTKKSERAKPKRKSSASGDAKK